MLLRTRHAVTVSSQIAPTAATTQDSDMFLVGPGRGGLSFSHLVAKLFKLIREPL